MKPTRKKKILFILHLPPPVHGVSVMNRIISDSQLINDTFDCDFINLSTAGKIENLQKHALYKYPQTLLIFLKVLFKLSTRRYSQVYITPFPYGFAFIKDSVTILLIRLYALKPILHLHTYGFKKASQRSALWQRYYKYVFKHVDVICLSKRLPEDIEGLYKGPVFILPNGIKQVNFKNTYQLQQAPVRLLFLSNLIKGKGILILLDAIELVKQHGIDFRLRIAGPESEVSYAELEQIIAEKDLANEVSLVGPKYNEDKYNEFRQADLFILPSDYETFGLVLLEAMQFGVPCISTNSGGIPDVLGDGRGLLLKEISAPALADAIEYLVAHPEERLRMSREGFEYSITHFTEAMFENGLVHILNRDPAAVTANL